MRIETIADAQSAAEKRAQAILDEARRESSILEQLPGHLPKPTISNSNHKFLGRHAGAWLSWRTYSQTLREDDYPSGASILLALEAHGLKPVPQTLCRWADYRPSAEPGLQEDMPETRLPHNRDKLTDSWPSMPVHVRVSAPWGDTEAAAFYWLPDGRLVKVLVKAPSGIAHVHCRRVEFQGGWRYEGGATLHVAKWAEEIISTDGPEDRLVARRHARSRAYRSTDQSLDGLLYWEPTGLQDEVEITPGIILGQFEVAAKRGL